MKTTLWAWIYFLEKDENGVKYIKIGYASHIQTSHKKGHAYNTNGLIRRMSGILACNPNPSSFKLLGLIKLNKKEAIKKECELHFQFSDHRVNGEWFEKTEELVQYIEKFTGKPENHEIVLPTKIEDKKEAHRKAMTKCMSKPIKDQFYNHYCSTKEAAIKLKIKRESIKACITKAGKTAFGRIFVYEHQQIPHKLMNKFWKTQGGRWNKGKTIWIELAHDPLIK
jgi:hypothetical protein